MVLFGIKDKRAALRALIEEHQESLLNKAVEKALRGSEVVLKLLLNRILPAKAKN